MWGLAGSARICFLNTKAFLLHEFPPSISTVPERVPAVGCKSVVQTTTWHSLFHFTSLVSAIIPSIVPDVQSHNCATKLLSFPATPAHGPKELMGQSEGVDALPQGPSLTAAPLPAALTGHPALCSPWWRKSNCFSNIYHVFLPLAYDSIQARVHVRDQARGRSE